MKVYTTGETALGPIFMVADDNILTGLYFSGQKHEPKPGLDWRPDPNSRFFKDAGLQLEEYFSGRRRAFDIPIGLQGTPFQMKVWKGLTSIPFGATLSYGELAQRVDKTTAVRAVGAAVGRNPVSVIVPCHRVIGHDGSLTGYAGGPDRKRALLDLEAGIRGSRG